MIGKMNFMEVVHVELSHKGRVSIMTIVARQYVFFQFLLVEYADTLELSVPIDDFGVLF